ncbi:MAG: type II toxin-antitoxin system VapC family toxin [Opitutales bacterium]|nr:type II toxin-antitoxin system VapC family toxin [Opitutales bacterium]NRA27249.1 type II toxin-antitoxin system VapC family toxin [Opitutales bacterium]
MIVVDTNVIAYLILPCKYTEAVERLRSTDDEWIAPDLWIHEMLSILVQNERHGQLESSDCMEILEDALALMKENTHTVAPEKTLRVATQTNCSAYDSQFIALARDFELKLYTFDRKVLRSCPDIAIKPE